MANPIKVVKAISRAVGGITGKGANSVNPVYKNGGAAPISNVKVVQTAKQRDAALQSAHDKEMADAIKQQSQQMFDNMSSGENFSKTKKINTDPARGR